MKRASEWVVTWVSEARPWEEQEARFNTWEGAMSYYRELIDSPLFSDVHIKALKQEPCEDCISRAEALKHSYIVYDDELEKHNVVSVEDIEDLPSVTPTSDAEGDYESGYNCGYTDAMNDIAESEDKYVSDKLE